MNLQFHKALYPTEVVTTCAQEYAAYLHTEQKEEGEYVVITYPPEEKKIAHEFTNYVLAAVRAHATK